MDESEYEVEVRALTAERDDLARPGGFKRDAAEQALEVEDAVHGAPQAFAVAQVGDSFADRAQARVDGVERLHGTQ